VGGVALAHDFAMGGLGHAAQANNEAAQLAIQTWPFFQTAQTVSRYLPWINLLLLLPLFLWWRTVKNRVPKN
jgi:hypothetical protein